MPGKLFVQTVAKVLHSPIIFSVVDFLFQCLLSGFWLLPYTLNYEPLRVKEYQVWRMKNG